MDFSFTPEQEAFRMELRRWIGDNLDPDLRVYDAMDERVAASREVFEKRRVWQAKLYQAGWAGIAWPREFGGRGAGLIEQIIYNEEYARARAPIVPGYLGLGMCGPTLIQYGTDVQKRRFVNRILSGEDIWCQGYSEPNAGSDLANVQTRAEDKGDYFVLNGQKIWTSAAQYADWMFLLARTDSTAPKHKGISYLLLDMKTKGVEVRPLVVASGHAHFNEVFFEDVEVPRENLVGPKNEGWRVAMTTLSYERAFVGGEGQAEAVRALTELAQRIEVEGQPAWQVPWVRQRLTALAIECQAAKYTQLRSLTRQLRGLPPGPEGSMLKLFGSELGVRIAHFATEMLGPYAQLGEPMPTVPEAPRWQSRVISSLQFRIAGGTSEIQKNIIGERSLGLPKD